MDIVWNGRSNVIDKAIRINGKAYINAPTPLSGPNKIGLTLTSKTGVVTTYDSTANPSFFSTSTTRTINGAVVRVIRLILASAGIAVGEYDAILTVYTSVYTIGLVVGTFRLSVRAG